MTGPEALSERELKILEAVVRAYVETAEPAGSQTIARRSGLGVSSATIRSTMNDLERKGYLSHPHTSAGRVPTDLGYRTYVETLPRGSQLRAGERHLLRSELTDGTTAARGAEEVLRRAAEVLGVLTQELGVAVAPALDEVVLERLDLVPVSSERVLLVFNLRSGVVRTIFVQVPAQVAPVALHEVQRVLNERLAGHTLREIRATLPERLRDSGGSDEGSRQLLNIFLAQGDELFDLDDAANGVVLGSARLLADQPEFAADSGRMRELLQLTERRDLLRSALESRRRRGLHISIGAEHDDPRLSGFTLVTSSYSAAGVAGVIGVMGPTRMPYDKIIRLVEHTSRLVEGLLA